MNYVHAIAAKNTRSVAVNKGTFLQAMRSAFLISCILAVDDKKEL